MEHPKAVSQRYFVSHIKELTEPVEVTIQRKDGSGTIETLGFFFPFSDIKEISPYIKQKSVRTDSDKA